MRSVVLSCDNIEATAATQVRVQLDKTAIEQYQADIEAGADMPNLIVFAEKGSERFILADGFHRLIANINAGMPGVGCDVHEGGMHEALIYALGANGGHGLRRTNADKVNAVEIALKDPELSQLTQQEIADICRVTRNTVGRLSQRLTLADAEKTEPAGDNPEGKPEANKPGNNRPTKEAPTQEAVEREELRAALKAIRAFPYTGRDATKLHLDSNDKADLEYVSGWTAQAALELRPKEVSDE